MFVWRKIEFEFKFWYSDFKIIEQVEDIDYKLNSNWKFFSSIKKMFLLSLRVDDRDEMSVFEEIDDINPHLFVMNTIEVFLRTSVNWTI